MTERICAKTGLALTSGPALSFRIARQSYGPLAPKPRVLGVDVGSWSRYDTVGRTIYTSADKVTAYMELLAPFRTEVTGRKRALQPLADSLGIALDDLWEQIVSDWDELGTLAADWLPRTFRDGRGLYTLSYPTGWWVDITAIETIAAVHDLFGGEWPTATGTSDEALTLSHLTGDDRILTTAIATRLREHVSLDDGTLPLGIQFISKYGKPAGGSGLCWAYWMRDLDNGLTEPTTVPAGEPIREADPAFKAALVHCGIRSR